MKKEEAQRIFDEKRKIVMDKLHTYDFSHKELEQILKEMDDMEEMKELTKAMENLNKAKD